MKKVGIVSCDKWKDKLQEDNNLKEELIKQGIDTKIISWQKPLDEKYDLLLLKSVWGYQNYYKEFKKWLLYIKEHNIPLVNNVDMILNNIRKDVQFEILRKNNIEVIDTTFLENLDIDDVEDCVIKPTISGSGENTFLISNKNLPNTIKKEEVKEKYKTILDNNSDCKIMIQPFIKEIDNGEYSCIFIDGKLTHTMLRFPNIFHEKKRPYLVSDVPESIIKLAKKVERIPEFRDYLYARVDMVLVDGKAKIMEVELADPDLLTKYIDDATTKKNVIKTLTKGIGGRIK